MVDAMKAETIRQLFREISQDIGFITDALGLTNHRQKRYEHMKKRRQRERRELKEKHKRQKEYLEKEKLRAERLTETVQNLFSLGYDFYENATYEQALETFEECLEICQRSEFHNEKAYSLLNYSIAKTLICLSKNEEAVEKCLLSLEQDSQVDLQKKYICLVYAYDNLADGVNAQYYARKLRPLAERNSDMAVKNYVDKILNKYMTIKKLTTGDSKSEFSLN
jgi:tetratricopeptide (TPR) repeat protein